MGEKTAQTVYFDRPGRENTSRTIEIAGERAKEIGIKKVLVASSSGNTGARAVKMYKGSGLETIVVGHPYGWKKKPNNQSFTSENQAIIESGGGKVLFCQHTLGGVNRAIRYKFDAIQLDELIAWVLRLMCEGYKACIEMSMMAADSGLVRVGEPCVCIAGTVKGADTAVVLTPSNSDHFFEIAVREIICKPYEGGAMQTPDM